MNELINYNSSDSLPGNIMPNHHNLINKVLDIYHDDFKFVKNINYKNEVFSSELLVDKYPYTKKQLFTYVTGPTLTLIVGQVAYVYTAFLIVNNLHQYLHDISLDKFISLRDDEKLVFGLLDFRFKRKIPMNIAFEMKIKLVASKRMKNFIYGKFEFEVENSLIGNTNFVMGLR